jgi:hypothetical protein
MERVGYQFATGGIKVFLHSSEIWVSAHLRNTPSNALIIILDTIKTIAGGQRGWSRQTTKETMFLYLFLVKG